MGLKMNLGEVEDRFTDLPAGDYHVALVDGEERTTSDDSKKPGNPFWNVEFLVQDGKWEGRRLWANLMLPPAYEPFTLKNLLRATGELTDDELEGELDIVLNEDEQETGDEFVLVRDDSPIEVVVKWGKNRKSGQMDIRRFKPYDEDEWEPDDEDEDSVSL